MTDKPIHLQEVPPDEPGAPTYAEMAQATDEAVMTMLESLREQHPAMRGATLAGATAALVRFHLAGMPADTHPRQVLELMAPTIHDTASQLYDARRGAAGMPPRPNPPASPAQLAYGALQRHLMGVPLPTYVILTKEGIVFLVSIYPRFDGVLSHASLPNVPDAVREPHRVIQDHVNAAAAAWACKGAGLIDERQAAIDALYLACGEEGSDEEEAIGNLPTALNEAMADVIRFATPGIGPKDDED